MDRNQAAINAGRAWRNEQRIRIGMPTGPAKERAKDLEHRALAELGRQLDLLELELEKIDPG